MNRCDLESIYSLFARNDGDGEFSLGSKDLPYFVIGPADGDGRIIYTTKPTTAVAALRKCGALESVGWIGRYGLPSTKDLTWISDILKGNILLFLGDMDPVDLLAFAWLRGHLSANRVEYIGVSDAFWGLLEASSVQPMTMPCSPSECDALELLKDVFPDFCSKIGARSTELLEQGRKIELEAILNCEINKPLMMRRLGLTGQ